MKPPAGGNIPAHAGKTVAALVNAPCFAEHPRARGENAPARRLKVIDGATAPRTRQNPVCIGPNARVQATSPRTRGKPWLWKAPQNNAKEHPRARGENAIAPATSALIGGTSPRTRGKLHGQLGADVDIRNIPAHAGKTI